jgi:hypothetical protein
MTLGPTATNRSNPITRRRSRLLRRGGSLDTISRVLLPVELDAVLAARGFARLIVSGAQTDACIRSTLHGALTRGYDTVLVSDAHTTEDHTEWGAPPPEQVIAHTNLYWTYQTAPGRTAGTMKIRVPRRKE